MSYIKAFFVSIFVISIIFSLIFKSLLSLIGYSVIPFEELKKLQASTKIVEKLKINRKNKPKAGIRFAQKTGKKIATASISSFALGTVGVAGVVAYLEIEDFCEQIKEDIELNNIIFSEKANFDAQQCFNEAEKYTKDVVTTSIISIGDSLHESKENLFGFTYYLFNNGKVLPLLKK